MHRVPDTSLWLGHIGDARDLRRVLATGILVMVDLAANEPPVTITRDLVYLRFPLIDGAGNPAWLVRAAIDTISALVRASAPTLVYCSNGMSRTPAVVAAALVRARGRPAEEMLTLVTAGAAHDVSTGLWQDIVAALSDESVTAPDNGA
jgi:protein-tyrosine phosphatase